LVLLIVETVTNVDRRRSWDEAACREISVRL